jgi:hypothetical protein
MNIDVEFCRTLLRDVNANVKLHFPKINLRTDAWVWCAGRDHWEFHGPQKFWWHGGAANAYDARAKGWTAWLQSKGIDA